MAKGITIGKNNCLNDIPVLLNSSVPNIVELLKKDFEAKNYKGMKKTIHRFKLVFEDLEDMVNELGK